MSTVDLEWCEGRLEVRTLFINAVLQVIHGTREGQLAEATWTRILERENAETTDWEIRRALPRGDARGRFVERVRELCAQLVEMGSDEGLGTGHKR